MDPRPELSTDELRLIGRILDARPGKKQPHIDAYAAWLRQKDPDDPKLRYLELAPQLKSLRNMLAKDPEHACRPRYVAMTRDAALLPNLNGQDTIIVDHIDTGASLIKSRGLYLDGLRLLGDKDAELQEVLHKIRAFKPDVLPTGKWEKLKGVFSRRPKPPGASDDLHHLRATLDQHNRERDIIGKRLDSMFAAHAPKWLKADLEKTLGKDVYEKQILPSAYMTTKGVVNSEPGEARRRFDDDMLAFLDVTEEQWLADGATILQHAPIRRLHLSNAEKTDKDLEVPGIQKLTDLNISFLRKADIQAESRGPLDRAALAGEMSKTAQQIKEILRYPRLARLETLRLDIPYAMESSSIPDIVKHVKTDDPESPFKGMSFHMGTLGNNAFCIEGHRSPEAAKECAAHFAKPPTNPADRIGPQRPDGTRPDPDTPHYEGR